ncbi:MAG: ABC-type molybdate transport system, periplasmic component [Pelotomaculum thermopropionicum]|uniref:ABC-type molybdate transport system, periplasmic component n=1 Tax=Pelotomaculum thermopropionicum TaxID=110500 RepID=A0A124FZ41_9FIRM|nr:MAG: ABC-type molybdate transport system, periplasmic component [Pelotomaculum thermopropionicum]
MKKILYILALTLLLTAVAAGCGSNEAKQNQEPVNLTVSAAASLTDAVKELKTVYESQQNEVTITLNLASSGTLQKQIEEGAPADLFISASKAKMDALSEKGLIVEDSRKDILNNNIVLIAGKESSLTGFEDLTGNRVEKISIGVPESVPAGRYAKEVLISLGLWDKINSKLVLAKTVRQVLAYVENGNVDAGLVYSSDTTISNRIKILAAAPSDSHKPIVYPVAVIKSSQYQKEARDFSEFLQSDEAARVFQKYGFKPI